MCTVRSVIGLRAGCRWLGCFPLCPGEGEAAGCSSVPGLPVNLAFQNCLCLTQNKSELCMSGRIPAPCHTQRCPEYLWKSRQWLPSCRRKQTLSESPGLWWLFFRLPSLLPSLRWGSGRAPRRFKAKRKPRLLGGPHLGGLTLVPKDTESSSSPVPELEDAWEWYQGTCRGF